MNSANHLKVVGRAPITSLHGICLGISPSSRKMWRTFWTILGSCCAFTGMASSCSVSAQDQVEARIPASVRLDRESTDESAGGLDCYKIETDDATYYLEKVGAGLSSMLDRDGNDWLGFHPRKGSGAAGEYRGFPNAVFKEAGSYFHPRNAGTDPCVTIVEEESPDRIVISALSGNGLWAGRYTFTADHCTFTLTRKPKGHNYWILYEGTPGGRYDDQDWWMTSVNATKSPLKDPHEGDITGPEWIAFGDPKLDRVLVLHHLEDDEHTDRFYQMEKKMTVFGFGREGMKKYLDSVPQSFSIGFIESTDHRKIGEAIAQRRPSVRKRNDRLEQFALTHRGDVESGRLLFHNDKRTQCSTCHRANNEGGEVGPDLSKIAGKFDRPHLIESLLTPSKQIVEGYRTSVIVGDDGRIYSGIVKSRNDQHITIIDAAYNSIVVKIASVEHEVETSVSMMPTGLADALSPQEFTDLLAYLETLRTGKASFGSGVTGPIELPDGFEITTVATGLSGTTAMEATGDGRILICEQHGTLRVVRDDRLLPEPFVEIPVEFNWERGLIGVTVSPDFPIDPHV